MDLPSVGLPWPVIAWLAAGALMLAGAVAVDARERGQPAALWFVLALVFPFFGALAYVVLRPDVESAPLEPAARAAQPTAGAPEQRPAPAVWQPSAGPTAPPEPRARPEYAPPPPSGPLETEPLAERQPYPSPPLVERSPAPSAPARSDEPTEWRRDVGVLSTARSPDVAARAPAPPRHPPPRRSRAAPWLVGGILAILVLVGGGILLSHLAPSLGAPSATPTPLPSPTTVPPTAEATAPDPVETRPTTSYTVQEGDTLGSIAEQHGTTVDALLQANSLDNPNLLVVGQRLVVPQ